MPTRGKSAHDVVIVGGGVIGCSIAYFLAAHHGIQAVILERDGIGSGASGNAAGELAAVGRHRYSDTYTKFILQGIAMHHELADEIVNASGIDYLFSDITQVRPALSQSEMADLQCQMEWQKSLGLAASWAESSELRSRYGWLSDKALGAVVTVEKQVESYPFCLAMLQAGERLGVRVKSGNATKIVPLTRGVIEVELESGETIQTDNLVIANGPWAVALGDSLGFTIPMTPLRGQIVHASLPSGFDLPSYSVFHDATYMLPKASGDLLLGTTDEVAGFNSFPTKEAERDILASVIDMIPLLESASVVRTTACLRPSTPDDLPIMGQIPDWDGIYLATGHGHKGITLALVTGKAIGDLIAKGTGDFDISMFSLSRFGTMH